MKKSIWMILALFLMIGALYLAFLGFQRYQALERPILNQADQPVLYIEIPKGAALPQILRIIKHALPGFDTVGFNILVRWQGLESNLQAGEYAIYNNLTTPIGLLDSLATGKVVQRPFTIIAGWTVDQLLKALADETLLSPLSSTWQAELAKHPVIAEKRRTLEIPSILRPEGLFWPETYYFSRPTTALDMLIRAEVHTLTQLEQAWANRSDRCPLKTPYEALILASIVEKETGVIEEYPLVAGVYCNRLAKGMPLQADPTVAYGLGLQNQALRLQDLKQPSPYNTYLQTGLPPTPIALSGNLALQAVLHPDKTSALYFVAVGDDSGRHVFSDTLQQHQLAVKAYRRRKQNIP